MATLTNSKVNRVHEYLRCKNDFDYYCRNYVLVELPGGDVILQPYGKQRELINLINAQRNVVVLKSRQIGISTIIQAYASWLMNFYDNVVVGIISKDGKEATDFARAVRGILEKLPPWMKPKGGKIEDGFDKKTEQSFILPNGSKCYSATVNPNAPNKTLRGKAITFLIIDEAAFIAHLDAAWTSMVPALSTSQKQARLVGIPYGTVILSTPNMTVGIGEWFYNRYTKAISGGGIFKPFTIHWRQIPELANDPKWYSDQCEMFDNDPRKIEQELEMKFLASSGSFFDDRTVSILQDCPRDPIEVSTLFGGEMWTWQRAIEGRHYIIGVDTAPEYGKDNSAITVFDYETLEQVWEYQVKCQVIDFIKVVKFATAQYPGTVVIENNSYGNQVMEEVNNSEFSNFMYKEKRGDKFIGGLSVNTKTRPLMIDALYSYITQYPTLVKSKRLALELVGLTKKTSGKVEANLGCTDDLALSLSMAFYVRKYDPPLMLQTSKFASSAFDNIVGLNYMRANRSSFNNPDVDDHEIDEEWMENKRQEIDIKAMRHVKDNIFTHDKSYINTLEFYKE